MLRLKIVIATLLINTGMITAQKYYELNGWEFLQWKMKKEAVEKKIDENEKLVTKGTALDANFKYGGLNTWLEYDEKGELVRVYQKETFSVIEYKESKECYESCMKEMIEKYGHPAEIINNTEDSLIKIKWALKNTKINMNQLKQVLKQNNIEEIQNQWNM